jgi:hypothetical protein
MLAAWMGHKDVARLLVNAGANKEVQHSVSIKLCQVSVFLHLQPNMFPKSLLFDTPTELCDSADVC